MTDTRSYPDRVSAPLSCPFCGHDAEVREGQTHDTWFVRCTICQCKTVTSYTKEEAVGTWNERVPGVALNVETIANIVSDYYDEDPAGRWLKCAQHIVAALRTGGAAQSSTDTLSLMKRPVAFRVPRTDPATAGETLGAEWRLFQDEEAARDAADNIGAEYQGLYVRDGSPLSAGLELIAGLFYKTRGNKHNLPLIIGPLEKTEDSQWPWLAIVSGQPWLWDAQGNAGSIPVGERGPHNRDLVENVTMSALASEAGSNCDCGFSAEACAANHCMRKKLATSGLKPDAKYPDTGTSSPSSTNRGGQT